MVPKSCRHDTLYKIWPNARPYFCRMFWAGQEFFNKLLYIQSCFIIWSLYFSVSLFIFIFCGVNQNDFTKLINDFHLLRLLSLMSCPTPTRPGMNYQQQWNCFHLWHWLFGVYLLRVTNNYPIRKYQFQNSSYQSGICLEPIRQFNDTTKH